MNKRYSIVVVGGGVTGLMAATLMARGPHCDALDITLVDADSTGAIDTVASSQDQDLVVLDVTATGNAEEVDVLADSNVSTDDATSAGAIDALAIQQEQDLTVVDASATGEIDSFGISQVNNNMVLVLRNG